MKKISRINTDDKYRILFTDTLPYELPIIFDNDGLYSFYKEYDENPDSVPSLLKKSSNLSDRVSYPKTIPYHYQVSKGYESYRELSLVHPSNQRMFVSYYDNYKDLILYSTSKSKYSLRYPKKVTSSIYRDRSNDDFYDLLGHEDVDIAGRDIYEKFSSTYFAYRKFNVMYKFFESPDYLRLERKFRFMASVDVSRCFDSIYTHSISWAVKSKGYSKSNLLNGNEFGGFDEEFDKVIRCGNDNETNGIVIGPEYSRVFAEIIFQDIDLNIYRKLSEKGLVSKVDYIVKRYLDDIFIFSKTKEVEKVVFEEVVKQLWDYKLRINESKTKMVQRPFVTARSKGVIDLRSKMGELLKRSFDEFKINHTFKVYKPKKIRNYYLESNNYIKNIKSSWFIGDEEDNGSFSNYVISAFLKTIKRTVIGFEKYYDDGLNSLCMNEIDKDKYLLDILSWFLMSIEVSSYCYLLSPKVSESFKLSQLLVQVHRFVEIHMPDSLDLIEHKVYEVIYHILQDDLSSHKPCGVETLNLLVVLSEISSAYNLKEEELIKIIYGSSEGSVAGYFSVIVALFISGNSSSYENIVKLSIDRSKEILSGKLSIVKSSEAFHLYLDLMSCPLLTMRQKSDISRIVLKTAGENCGGRPASELMLFCSNRNWFVNWGGVDLIRMLQRKLLKKVY